MPFQIPLASGVRDGLEVRAGSGDKAAQQALSEINADWAGEKPDYVAALYWFEKAAANPSMSPTANFRFRGLSAFDADRLRKFNVEHAALFAKTQDGDPRALYDFAWHIPHKASGVAGDDQMAHWLLLAARAGDHRAQAQIGYLYFRSFYVRGLRSYNASEAAREKVYPEMRGDMSVDLRDDEPLGFDDEGTATDIGDAIAWFGKAGAAGDTLAQYNLGLAYAVDNKTRNWAAASRWLHQALFSNPVLPVTACDLDLTGRVVIGPENESGARPAPTDAFNCYNRVKARHPGAYYMLGYMYHHGLGVHRDDTRAIPLLEKAARYSDWRPRALNELSRLYRDSPTIQRDRVTSVFWLAMAMIAPLAPRTYCGGPVDDKGGPQPPEAFENDGTWEELNALYAALSSAQKAAVRKRLKLHAPDLQVGPDGFVTPMIYPQSPCV